MRRKANVLGWLLAFGHALGVGGCVYDTPRLGMPPGAGDASLGDSHHADPDCQLRPDSTCNHAPVAVINRGAAEFKVGGNAWVVLTAQNSEDQDGDPLSYQWDITGGCTSDVGNAHTEATFAIWSLPATEASACSIKLTVSDGYESASASVVVVVVDVGARVRNVPETGCAQLEPDFSDVLGKGTPTNPWCTIADAIAVAEHFSLGDVEVAVGTYVESSLSVPPNLTVRGGFTAEFAGDEFAKSEIIVSDPVGVTLQPGGLNTLAQLAIRFAGPCADARCVLVQVDGSDSTITDSYLGTGAAQMEALSAPGKEIVALSASGGTFVVTVSNTVIVMPSAAHVAVGLELTGNGSSDAYVDGVQIMGPLVESSGRVTGIQSTDMCLLEIQSNTTVRLVLSASSGAVEAQPKVFGLHDGQLGSEPEADCGDEVACHGSGQISIGELDARVRNEAAAGNAEAVALYDTGAAYLKTHDTAAQIMLQADASDEAVALHSVAAGTVLFERYTGGTVDATVGFYKKALRQVAVMDGLVDGSVPNEFALVPASGSDTWALVRAQLRNSDRWLDTAPRSRSYSAGAIWAGSQSVQMLGVNDANVADASMRVAVGLNIDSGNTSDVFAPEVMAGVWLLAANNVEMRGMDVQTSAGLGLAASRLMAGVLDGDVTAVHAPVAGSSNVTLLDSNFDLRFADVRNGNVGLATARMGCVLLNGTQQGEIGTQDLPEQTFACHNTGRTLAEPPTHDLWLLATRELHVHHNLLGVAGTMMDNGLLISGAHVALRDGQGEVDDDLPEPSNVLTISHNRVAPRDRQLYQSDIGIFLDHGSGLGSKPEPAAIYNNVVFAVPANLPNGDNVTTSRVVGVALTGASPWLVHNTIHGGLCGSTSTMNCTHLAETVALFMVNPDGANSTTLVNNIFSVGDGMIAIGVLDNQALLNNEELTLGAKFEHNVLVDTRLMGRSPSYFCAYSTATGDSLCLVNDNMLAPLALRGSARTTDWPFCLSDNVHLGSASDDANLMIDQGDAEIVLPAPDDFEGEARVGLPDIGADEKALNAVCP